VILAIRRRLDAEAEAGFTLAEVLVAMIVIAVGLLGLMAVQVRSLSSIALAKERQTASGLANRAMEQLRALPYTALQGGLRCTELAGDPNLSVASPSGSCTATFSPGYDSSISAESLVTTTAASQAAPLSPHQSSDIAINAATYRVRDYITRANSDPSVDAGYWLTVISTWTSANSGEATKSIALRSKVYSPSGCLSPTTHPFSGPCQAFFYSDAGTSSGSIVVDASRGVGVPVVDGMTARTGTVALPSLSSRTQYEQSLSTQSRFVTSLATLVDSSTTSNGGVSGSSSADTDPATGTVSTPPAATTGVQSAGTLSATGGGSELDVKAAGSESGSAYATTAAAASPACADNNGATLSGGQNCASATLIPGGTSALALLLNGLGGRGMTLADFGGGATGSRAFGGRFPTPSASPAHCTTTSGTGCVAAGVSRFLGDAHAGGFPAALSGDRLLDDAGVDRRTAIGTRPLVSVTSYADAASAESGIGPGSATSTRNGTLIYWNGIGFTAVPLATTGADSYAIPRVTGQYGGTSGTSIMASGTVVLSAPVRPASGSSPCLAAACGVKAGSGTVVATLSYSVFSGPAPQTQIGGFTVRLDLGSAIAQTTYKGAPSA